MKLFKSIKKLFQETPRFPEVEGNWEGAGILFTSHNTILAGYKVIDDEWELSGFGGKKLENELYYQTAIRETLEEIYEVPVTPNIVNYVASRLKITKVVNNNGYIVVIVSLNQFKHFMLAAINFNFDTPMYKELPTSSVELIGKRDNKFFSEFPYLGFVSTKFIGSKNSPICVDRNLISDMKYI